MKTVLSIDHLRAHCRTSDLKSKTAISVAKKGPQHIFMASHILSNKKSGYIVLEKTYFLLSDPVSWTIYPLPPTAFVEAH